MRDIIKDVDRMDQWIRKLILVGHSQTMLPSHARVEEIVRRCLSDLSNEIVERNISLRADLADQSPSILCDQERLEQAINKLISNALQAMPRGGQLVVEMQSSQNRDAIDLTISDTGEGIPRHKLDQVFKPFFTSKESGFGLGLPLAKRIVERQGGSLSLSSREGIGTTVFVRFPVESD
jgi:signal transduction histidine kinase